MSKGKKKKYTIEIPFTAIENSLTDSAPWKDLPVNARYIYFEIRKKWAGRDRGHIVFTHEEAGEFMAGGTFKKTRDKLVENGFINVVERGGLWGKKAIFALSDRWRKWNTKEFKKIDIDKLPKRSYFFKKGHSYYGKK